MRNVVVALMLVLAIGCAKATGSAVSPGDQTSSAPPTDLKSAEAAWRQAGITSYTMDVKVTGCMACGEPVEYSVTVVDGQVTDQTSPGDLKHPETLTVETLFRWIGAFGDDAVQATYNDVGVPIEAHVDAPDMADEQADYAVTFNQT
jgi:hypothetical protein